MDLWPLIGRLAVIATLLTAIFKFIAWWRSPKGKLSVNVLPVPFVLPPSVESEFNAAGENVRHAVDEFLSRHPKKPEGYDESYYRVSDLAGDVRRAANNQLSFETRFLTGSWHARVENLGKMKCSGVNLHLPHATLARLQHDSDREPTTMPVQGVVTIGDLRPRGHCYVTAWTNQRVSNRDNYDVILSHDAGFGRVNGQWQTTRLGWIVGTLVQRENLLSFVGLLFFMLLGIGFATLGLVPLLTKKNSSPHSSNTDSRPSPSPSISATP